MKYTVKDIIDVLSESTQDYIYDEYQNIFTESSILGASVVGGVVGATLGRYDVCKRWFNEITSYIKSKDANFISLKDMTYKTLKNYKTNNGNVSGEEVRLNKIFMTFYKAYKKCYFEVYKYNNKDILVGMYNFDVNELGNGNKRTEIEILDNNLKKYKNYYLQALALKRGFLTKPLDNWINNVYKIVKDKTIDDTEKYEKIKQFL